MLGANVAVREPGLVHLVERLGERLQHPAGLVHVHGARAGEARREHLAVDVVGGDVGAAVGEQARAEDLLHRGVVHGAEGALRDEEAVERAAIAGVALAQHLEVHLPAAAVAAEVDRREPLVGLLLQHLEAVDDRARREVVRGAALVHGAQAGLGAAVGQQDRVGQGLVELLAHAALGERAGEGGLARLGIDALRREPEELAGDALQAVEVIETLELGAEDVDGADGCRGCHDGYGAPNARRVRSERPLNARRAADRARIVHNPPGETPGSGEGGAADVPEVPRRRGRGPGAQRPGAQRTERPPRSAQRTSPSRSDGAPATSLVTWSSESAGCAFGSDGRALSGATTDGTAAGDRSRVALRVHPDGLRVPSLHVDPR